MVNLSSVNNLLTAAAGIAGNGGGEGGGTPNSGNANDGAAVSISTTKSFIGPDQCPSTTVNMNAQWQKFHTDGVCNRQAYTEFKESRKRSEKYQYLKTTGDHRHVPNQKTCVCPQTLEDWSVAGVDDGIGIVSEGTSAPVATGYDTTWIVENTASSPIVLTWVKAPGVEVAALHPEITNPLDDPDSLVLPGQSKVVHTYEGHVFYARELTTDDDSTGGIPTLGNVLLQHRTGLIPVGQHAHFLTCPIVDVEPTIENLKTGQCSRAPEYERTMYRQLKECNLLDIGFRNMAHCPVHAYWVQPDTCEETFKFHLGIRDTVDDFAWDWTSRTKFESTFMGHTFVFRNAASGEWVESITLQPTKVVDCPSMKQQISAKIAIPGNVQEGIVMPNGEQLLESEGDDEQQQHDVASARAAAAVNTDDDEQEETTERVAPADRLVYTNAVDGAAGMGGYSVLN